ncbi:glycosyl hydrolase family 28-related protein [Pseudoalteromonas rubra]|uniref:glycosyl hydrolase family 28-related protein n=1 Tax=Pseudoalteromonas rubra TaxID=43658 RepID=UPI0013DDF584|nr:glycosyl hydrolase family 28-related protein [Pseudoalteromonas rubra]
MNDRNSRRAFLKNGGLAAGGAALTVLATNVSANNTLTNSGTASVTNIKDFGAVGNGEVDDWAAINSAIESAQTNNSATLFIPAESWTPLVRHIQPFFR